MENFIVEGNKLKKVPKIYNFESEVAEYLKHKSWYLEYKITDSEIIENENLLDMIVQKFMLMKDFNHFLNRALADFEMPERKENR